MTNSTNRSTRRDIACSILGLALATLTPSVQASDFYARLIGGAGWLSDSDVQPGGNPAAKGKFDVGFDAGGALGYTRNNWRLEAELLYRTNDTDSLSGPALPPGSDGGDFSSLGIGANAIYQFDLLGSPRAVSYVGAGIVWLQEIDIDFDTPAGELSYSDDDWGYQLFAGARYQIRDRWHLTAEVRYFDAGSVALNGESSAPGRIKTDYQRTSLLFGLGYAF